MDKIFVPFAIILMLLTSFEFYLFVCFAAVSAIGLNTCRYLYKILKRYDPVSFKATPD